jgi:transposase
VPSQAPTAGPDIHTFIHTFSTAVAAGRQLAAAAVRGLPAIRKTGCRSRRQPGTLVTQTAPQLLAVFGVGIDTAAALLVTAGDNPGRLRSEAAWAHLCGTAPIPASSGR